MNTHSCIYFKEQHAQGCTPNSSPLVPHLVNPMKTNNRQNKNRDRRRSQAKTQDLTRERLTLRHCKPGLIVWHLPSRTKLQIRRHHYGMVVAVNGLGVELQTHPRKLAIAYPTDACTDRLDRLVEELDYENRVKAAKRECRNLYHFDPSQAALHGRPVTWQECLMVPLYL